MWTAVGQESNGALRHHECLSYVYDPAGNLTSRQNESLVQSFGIQPGSWNRLGSASDNGFITVSGVALGVINSLTVNGTAATVYSDGTFGAVAMAAAGTYTATAQGAAGNTATDTITDNLGSPVTFGYDDNGNLTSDGQRTFHYDDADQLIQVDVAGQGRVEYVYDALGRRRVRKDYNGSGQLLSQTRYIYDGMRVIQERDGNNTPLVTYTRGLDLSGSLEGAGGIGGLLARTDGAGTVYYHSDGIGNVTALVDGQHRFVARYVYEPFGNVIGMAGPLVEANTQRFSGKEWDSKTGLYYFGFRWYDPNLQRWINRDPLGEHGGLNLYQFVGNDPMGHIDPDGEDWKDWFANTVTGVMLWYRTIVGGPEPPPVPRPPDTYRQEQCKKVQKGTPLRKNPGLGGPNPKPPRYPLGGKLPGLLPLVPGFLEDIDRWQRGRDNGRSWLEQLQEDYKNSPQIITPYGPIINPMYDPKKDIIVASVSPGDIDNEATEAAAKDDELILAETSQKDGASVDSDDPVE